MRVNQNLNSGVQEAPAEAVSAEAREILGEVEVRYSRLKEHLEKSYVEREKTLSAAWQARYDEDFRRIKAEAAEVQKNLLAEVESRNNVLLKELESAFTVRQRVFEGDLESASKREQDLLGKLRLWRIGFFGVLVLAAVSTLLFLDSKIHFKSYLKKAAPAAAPVEQAAVLGTVSQPVQAVTPVGEAPKVEAVAAVVPVKEESAVPTPAPAAKKGNGGNFSGGMLYSK